MGSALCHSDTPNTDASPYIPRLFFGRTYVTHIQYNPCISKLRNCTLMCLLSCELQ